MAKAELNFGELGGSGGVLVTIYSAALDTIECQFGNDTFYVPTKSNGQAEVFLPKGSITFTSSIAKDPSDASLQTLYSKTVDVTNSTTDVYVMPDGKIYYWYGYEPETAITLYNNWGYRYISTGWNRSSQSAKSSATNYYQIYQSSTSGSSAGCIGACYNDTPVDFSNYTKARLMFTGTISQGLYLYVNSSNTGGTSYNVAGNETSSASSSLKLLELDLSNVSATAYLVTGGRNDGANKNYDTYALWLE